jgi:hypothetical protein
LCLIVGHAQPPNLVPTTAAAHGDAFPKKEEKNKNPQKKSEYFENLLMACGND